jgi:hypothetical protein
MLDGEQISPERQKLLRAIREFGNYIAANQACIPDYGDRHRNAEPISSAFANSAVNQLVSRRITPTAPKRTTTWAPRYPQAIVFQRLCPN